MAAGQRSQRTPDPYLEEVHAAIVLLRQHSFLRYQKNSSEYELKRRAAIDAVLHAVRMKTGVTLPAVYDAIDMETLREASAVSVRRLLKGAITVMKRSLAASGWGGQEAALARALQAWEQAVQLL
jgi:hypothetical protein